MSTASKRVTITLTTDNLNALDLFRLGELLPFEPDDNTNPRNVVTLTVTRIEAEQTE